MTKLRSLPTTTSGDKEISSSAFTHHKYSHPADTLQLPVLVSTYGSESSRSPTVAVRWATLVFVISSPQVQISACKPANFKFFVVLLNPNAQMPDRIATLQINLSYGQRRSIDQGCTNAGHQVTVATKLRKVEPNIGGSSGWYFISLTLLQFTILRCLLHFWYVCTPLK